MGTATEVLESEKFGKVEVMAEWSHSLKTGSVVIYGGDGEDLVLLGTVTNQVDLIDLFDEVCELFERLHLKKVLTVATI